MGGGSIKIWMIVHQQTNTHNPTQFRSVHEITSSEKEAPSSSQTSFLCSRMNRMCQWNTHKVVNVSLEPEILNFHDKPLGKAHNSMEEAAMGFSQFGVTCVVFEQDRAREPVHVIWLTVEWVNVAQLHKLDFRFAGQPVDINADWIPPRFLLSRPIHFGNSSIQWLPSSDWRSTIKTFGFRGEIGHSTTCTLYPSASLRQVRQTPQIDFWISAKVR